MQKKPSLSRRADGRYVKVITDPRTGKKHFFYGRSEREINVKILEYTKKQETGRTFAEVADEWWEETLERIAFQTRHGYKPALRRAVEEFGEMPVKNIKPRDISKFLRTLSKNFAAKTLANQRMIINLILDVAVLGGDIEVNPCTAVKTPKTERHIRQAAPTNEEDLVRQYTDVWLFPFFALMSGMRKGEILALQWKDIDFDKNTISVTKSIYHESNVPKIKEPKTKAGWRTIPLLLPLKKELLKISEHKTEAYIFSSDKGKTPLSHTKFTALYKAFCKTTGVSSTAHQLRHSFATIAFECGVPIKSVQEILGHKQISTTMDIYTDFRKKSVEEAASILNAKLVK